MKFIYWKFGISPKITTQDKFTLFAHWDQNYPIYWFLEDFILFIADEWLSISLTALKAPRRDSLPVGWPWPDSLDPEWSWAGRG